jgi:Ser/Thr protein kinase RdoA (MazF antagonist)
MGQLFKPDIFSQSTPVFGALSPKLLGTVLECGKFYGLEEATSVEQFGGNEVNSNNFKIIAPGRKLLLKRLPGTAKAPVIRRQLALLEWLVLKGAAVAPLLRSRNGLPYLSWQDAYWCGFEFVEGDFFAGGQRQVEAAAHAIGDLQLALMHVPDSIAPPRKWDYDVPRLKAAAVDMEARSGDWPSFFGEDGAAALEQAWQSSVLGALAQVEESSHLLEGTGISVCHADLHPHNLLMNGDAIGAVIDFESFTKMPTVTALGFATYKLMRQHCVSQGLDESDAATIAGHSRIFIDGVAKALPSGEAAGLLRAGAVIELYRRMTIIFRLNLDQGNSAWNHVLSMHLAAMKEIPVIFGS